MARQTIAVIGGGLMGAGIAQTFAAAGHKIAVCEPVDDVRASLIERVREGLAQLGDDPAFADNIVVTSDLETAVQDASFITEAAPEKLELKRSIFADLVAHAPREAVLASNSSVMPIGSIAEGLETAERIVGTHWWNPAVLIPLVEVIEGERTSLETVDYTMRLLTSAGKKPAHVKNVHGGDKPGQWSAGVLLSAAV